MILELTAGIGGRWGVRRHLVVRAAQPGSLGRSLLLPGGTRGRGRGLLSGP